MDYDINAPAARAVLQELTSKVNTRVNEQGPHSKGSLAANDQ